MTFAGCGRVDFCGVAVVCGCVDVELPDCIDGGCSAEDFCVCVTGNVDDFFAGGGAFLRSRCAAGALTFLQ